MNKKVSLLIAISILVTTMFSVATFAATANPTASTVLVDGNNVAFDAYNIADNNGENRDISSGMKLRKQ